MMAQYGDTSELHEGFYASGLAAIYFPDHSHFKFPLVFKFPIQSDWPQVKFGNVVIGRNFEIL